MSAKKFSILGGDLRQLKMANSIINDGHFVKCFGFTKGLEMSEHIENCNSISNVVKDMDTIILPLPCSKEDIYLNAPFWEEKILLSDIFKVINKNQLIVAGKISEKVHNLAKAHNTYLIDYFEREELAILNAIPTAEPKEAYR